jgi:hypothetical protein
VRDDAKFCNKCGAKCGTGDTATTSASNENTNPRRSVGDGVGNAVSLLVGLGAIGLWVVLSICVFCGVGIGSALGLVWVISGLISLILGIFAIVESVKEGESVVGGVVIILIVIIPWIILVNKA